MVELNNFAFQIASAQQQTQRVGFELQFNLLQNGLIERFNRDVEEISQTPLNTAREIDSLQSRAESLADKLPAIETYRQGQFNTRGSLEAIFDEVTALFNTFNSDETVDAAEVEVFNEQRDIVAGKIENLFFFEHPDINDANVIPNLKADVDALRELTLETGDITSDQNTTVTDFLSSLQSEISVAITVTTVTISSTLDLEQNIQSAFTRTTDRLEDLTNEEQQSRELDIANLEAQLGNVLRAISLSFEVSSSLSEVLTNRLQKPVIDPGSVVNLVT